MTTNEWRELTLSSFIFLIGVYSRSAQDPVVFSVSLAAALQVPHIPYVQRWGKREQQHIMLTCLFVKVSLSNKLNYDCENTMYGLMGCHAISSVTTQACPFFKLSRSSCLICIPRYIVAANTWTYIMDNSLWGGHYSGITPDTVMEAQRLWRTWITLKEVITQ